jgi:hypothetical protein
MAAFVKPKGTNTSYWSISTPNGSTTGSGWGYDLGSPISVTTLSGGEEIEGGKLSNNQKVVLNFGVLEKSKYHVIVRVNHELGRYGTILAYPTMVEPGERVTIDVLLKVDKPFSLTDIPWFVRLYMVD